MTKKTHLFAEDPFFVSRRKFMIVGSAFAASFLLPFGWVTQQMQSRHDYIKARAAGLYKDDAIANIRVSHSNPSITKYYQEFGGNPLGHVSHDLLHTHFVDRTKPESERYAATHEQGQV